MCDPVSKSSVKQGGKATAGWLTLGQGDPYGGSSELLGEELCGCVLAKLVPAAHGSLRAGAVPQCVPGPARVPSEFCFSFWLGCVGEAQSGCGVMGVSVSHSLCVTGCCTSVKHRVSVTPFNGAAASSTLNLKLLMLADESLKSLLHCTRGACSFSQLLIILFS